MNSVFGGSEVSQYFSMLNLGKGCADAVNGAFKGMPTTIDFAAIRTACSGNYKFLQQKSHVKKIYPSFLQP